jgi:hypothetical protein
MMWGLFLFRGREETLTTELNTRSSLLFLEKGKRTHTGTL